MRFRLGGQEQRKAVRMHGDGISERGEETGRERERERQTDKERERNNYDTETKNNTTRKGNHSGRLS